MKILCRLLLALLFGTASFAAEGTRVPLLFRYDPAADFSKPPVRDKADPRGRLDSYAIERLDVGGKYRRPSWIDSMPIVVWGSSIDKGLFMFKIGDGYLALRANRNKLFNYKLSW